MVKNQRGFSLVELLAIIIITTTIIIPLLSSLVGNIEVNYRFHDRRSAASVADGAINSINKLSFTDLDTFVSDAITNDNDYYIELNSDTCITYFSAPAQADDQALCLQIFNSIWNNLSFDTTTFRVFVYDYNIDLTEAALDSYFDGSGLPQRAIDGIKSYAEVGTAQPSLLRVTIWIQYDEEPDDTIILSGLIFDDIINYEGG